MATIAFYGNAIFFGFVIKLHRMHTISSGTQAKKILQIIKVSITPGHIILLCALGIYTRLIWYCRGQSDLAL
jgi:hypothetical protein